MTKSSSVYLRSGKSEQHRIHVGCLNSLPAFPQACPLQSQLVEELSQEYTDARFLLWDANANIVSEQAACAQCINDNNSVS
jgi:hypothetical protein